MAKLKSSKEILEQAKNNLKKEEDYKKNINEMELEVEKNTEEFNEELNNSSTSIVTIHEEFSRHTENINKLVNNIVSSVMQLNQTVKVYTSNNQITNSLLASNLVSLGQITSVLSAFRADYIMIQNGKDINGDGYYDKNLINDITKGIKNIKDKNIKKMIQELSAVGNFANVMSNAVRPRVGNNRRDGSGNGEGLFSRLLGRFLPDDYKDIASPILQMLPMFGIDDSNIKNLATSILNKKDPNASKKFIDPLNQAITDILNSPDDASGKGIFKKFLAGKFADITGFGDAKGKVREKNPKKVLAALAPLADDIKDMVEFKKEAFIKTPSILKKKAIYAVPVWIVNSSYQENGLKKKYDTSNDELEILIEKIKNIVSGNSSNLKDKNGELLFNYNPMTGEYEGELAERFLELIGKKDASYDEREKSIRNIYNQGLNKNKFDYDNIYYTDTNIDENGEIHYEQKKHTSKLGKNLTTIDLKNFDKAFELAQGGPIGAAINIFTGGLRDVGGVKGFIKGLGSDVKSIWNAGKESLPHHKGGRKAKRNKRNNQIEVAVLHQDEKVLKPEELSRQQSINDISKAFSISISALSTLNELSKLRLMLFNKWVNKEQIDPQKVKISSTVAGSDFIKNHLGKDAKFSLRKFREISLSLPDLIPKPKKEIQHEKHLKMKDIWGEKEKANIAEEESKDAKDDAEKTNDEANEKIEEQISNAEKEAQENAEQQIQENAEQSEAKVAEAQEQQEQQAQSEISQHQEQMENEVQEVKNEQQAKADKEKEVIKEEQEKRDKMKQEHSEEMSKLKEDDSVSRRKNKKEHNIKMLAKEKAGKIKNWGIKKAGNIKAWALEKKSKIKQNKTKFKKLVKRLARKSKKLVKLLSRKLKSIGKRMIKKLMASKLAAKIKSIGAFGSNIIKMAGKGIKAVITALKAIPLYGKIAAIGVSVAAALGITAMVAGFKSAAKKGKDGAKDDSEKLIKQADKNGDKYKKEAEKDEKKKKKKEKQEEKQETKENKELEKEDKNDNKNENAKQLLSALTNPIGFVAKKLSEKLKRRKVYISENGVVIDSETNKPIKSNENPNEFLMKDSNEFEKRKYEFNIENNLKTNIRNKIKNVANKTKEKLSSSNYNKNNKNNKFTNNPMDIFKYMNANMLSSLMKFTDSNLGRKFINDPEKAANFMFLLNGGANALGMRDAKNDVLGNIQGASSVTSTSFGGLFSGLLKRKLKTSDIGNKDNNYSENIDLAYSQVKQAENANNLINAFGIGLGLTEISDNGKALFTSDLVKQEQAAAFAAAAQAGGTSSTVSASDISDGSETDTVGTCGTYGSSSVSNNTPYEKYVRTCSSNGKVNKVTNSYNSYMLKNTKSNKIDFIKDYYKKFSSSLIHLNANDQKTAYTTFLNDVLDSTYYKSSTERTRRSILRSLSDNGFDFAKYGKGKNYGIARRRSSIDNDFLSASKYALQNNYKEKNGGTYPKFFKDYLSKSGINVKQNSSTEKIKSSLMNGSPVILMGKDEYETGKTPFGSEPHYVVATGYDGKNIRIEDSESETGGDIYDANSVLSHSSLKMIADEDSNVSSNSYRSYSGSNNNSHNSLRNYRTQSANSLYKNYNRIYSSSTNNPSTTKKNYIVSGKAKYGKGYNETIESNPTILQGAQDGWTQYGILASVTLAQAILESGLGTSTIAREANNWFGHSYGFGSSKYTVGKYISSNGRSWAKYANAGDSFRDHAYVLSGQSGNTRYVAAVGETDPLKCITAIENGGYCEGDKQSYINKVMDIINSYNLTKYDTGTFNGKAAGGTAYSKTCWTGDSRTVQMHNYFTDLEIYASKGGQTIDYFLNHYSEISNKEGYNIFCWYGVNGATRQGGVKTATAYNKLASDLKGKSQIFVGTIGHCPNGTGSGKVEGGAGQSIETQNKGVEEFNEALKGKLSSDIKVIDTYTYIKQLESEMGASKMTTDNLHYTKEASEKIKSYVESQIASMSGSSGNSTASASMGGTYYGQINITLSGYVDAKDTFSKYKQGSGIWDEYYDSLSPSEEEGESSENSDSSNTNSSSAEPSGGSNTNSSNSSSAKPSGGSNNHNNGNNSLNTNSNNGSVINNSNNSTNTNNGNINNNSSNNESSLIQGDNSITDVYKKGNVTYVVNTVEYGEKNNIKEILDYFKELNEIQDDSLDVLQIIYEKILKRQGKTKKPIPGLNFDLKTKHGMVHNF